MKVRSKTLLITIGAITVLVIVFFGASSVVLVDSFASLERKNTRLTVEKVMDHLSAEVEMLSASATVYAHWNETYEFAMGNNSEYSRMGIPDSTFENLGVNIIVILDCQGEIIYKLAYQSELGEMPVPMSFLKHLEGNTTITGFDYQKGGLGGMLLAKDTPYEVVAHSILRNDKSGPSAGIFVMAKELEADISQQTMHEVGYPAVIYPLGDADLESQLQGQGIADLNAEGFAEVAVDQELIFGYGVIADIDGNPAAVVRVEMPRSIYQQAQSSEANLLIVLGVSGLVLSLLVVYTLEVYVISRVERLDRDVRRIGQGADANLRVDLGAKDEMGNLADSINEMLDTIQSVERKVQESERRYRAVVEDQAELIIRTTPQSSITFANSAFLRFYGLERGEEEGIDFIPASSEEQQHVLHLKLSSLSSSEPVAEYEQEIILNEQRRWVQWTVRGIFGSEGRLTELQWVGRDVTERMRFLERLNKTEKIESLGVLAGGIAHDFNNMLTSIRGTLTILKRDLGQDSSKRRRIEDAERSVVKATELTKQLLTFSKGGEPITKTIDVRKFVVEASEFAIHGSDVMLKADFPPDLWQVEADEGQLFQVVSNLIINARQAMPSGGTITIGGRNHLQTAVGSLPLNPGDYVAISVSDEGVGIPKEFQSRIFDPYFTTKRDGTGLGLTIVHSILKRHGGFIDVESEVGQGSTFNIYLPAAQGDALEHEEALRPSALQGGRLLLMDDEESVLDVGSELLRQYGYAVDVASTGEEALAAFDRAVAGGRPYSLVIMDLTIRGGMGGKEANLILKRNYPWALSIVSSGYSNDPVMANHRAYGFDGVVEKPYSIERMVMTVETILKDRPNGRALPAEQGEGVPSSTNASS